MKLEDKTIFSKSWLLTPGECNAEKELPVWLLVERIIDVATCHANSWNVGYAKLITDNQAWVLSRVTIEMQRWPKVNEFYTLTTWVEDFNRHFSERNIEISDSQGNVIGYSRTIWFVINLETRKSCDISQFESIRGNVSSKVCPIEKQSHIKPFLAEKVANYTFKYSDIDFNGHVNSLRYIRLLLDQWPLSFHDNHEIKRFEIAYMNEGKAHQEVAISLSESSEDCKLEIIGKESPICRARIIYKSR